jgi:hypothetical protein
MKNEATLLEVKKVKDGTAMLFSKHKAIKKGAMTLSNMHR